MINCRFILKNGHTIDHTVSETCARNIHQKIQQQHQDVISVEDIYGNITVSLVRTEIVAYVRMPPL